ncbi:hypothetical protein B0T16DRAFT_49523 [Cercophora newfieldiana]|uniref:Uncharacterized protein n=1 Tax=Cercophora newfieldiana TaxID=92897 RepID=A0AA39YQU3_9PEZI|nr:hypothetical protein B0T16DRAFT_49523 [Cercophora newfieldiana]
MERQTGRGCLARPSGFHVGPPGRPQWAGTAKSREGSAHCTACFAGNICGCEFEAQRRGRCMFHSIGYSVLLTCQFNLKSTIGWMMCMWESRHLMMGLYRFIHWLSGVVSLFSLLVIP